MTIKCPDKAGIIYRVAGALIEVGGNVLEQAQFTDEDSGVFCMRTKFESPVADLAAVRAVVSARVMSLGPELTLRHEADHRRAMILVSKHDHCLLDLLYRFGNGELPIDIPVIVSNHEDCREIADRYEIPYVYLPVNLDIKAEQEARVLELIEEHSIDVVVLARYMQVLSSEFCDKMSGRVINIHHSFLPGFKGARPYQRAHERGVKLIGATAHFVTGDLDEGPIIEQSVERVNHGHTASDLVEIGRDVERVVLYRAVRLFAEDRIILTGQRTVVFS
ncbi:MAG: formyltetrahydrofolate deformylase [Candidatus Nanopelagicales bacterium]|nr:formyltetrahydrofolate deformylase [Candidatus Nanopelagicales bacterium]